MKEYEFRFEDMFFEIKSSDTILYQVIFYLKTLRIRNYRVKYEILSQILFTKRKK